VGPEWLRALGSWTQLRRGSIAHEPVGSRRVSVSSAQGHTRAGFGDRERYPMPRPASTPSTDPRSPTGARPGSDGRLRHGQHRICGAGPRAGIRTSCAAASGLSAARRGRVGIAQRGQGGGTRDVALAGPTRQISAGRGTVCRWGEYASGLVGADVSSGRAARFEPRPPRTAHGSWPPSSTRTRPWAVGAFHTTERQCPWRCSNGHAAGPLGIHRD